jgi:hypothetical protein
MVELLSFPESATYECPVSQGGQAAAANALMELMLAD